MAPKGKYTRAGCETAAETAVNTHKVKLVEKLKDCDASKNFETACRPCRVS